MSRGEAARRIGLVAAPAVLLLLAWLLFGGRAPLQPGPEASSPESSRGVPPAASRRQDAKERTEIAEETSAPVPGGTAQAPAAAGSIHVVTNVPGASLTVAFRFFGGDPDPPPVNGTTDEKGAAVFAVPAHPTPLASVVVDSRAEGHAPDREERWAPVQEIRMELRRGQPVRGRVVGEDGAPIRDAMIGGGWTGVATAADGTFEVSWGEPVIRLQVDHPGYLRSNTGEAIPVPSSGVEIRLKRGLEVSGRVAFPDGRPVPGARLQADGVRVQATADADGRYMLGGLQPGSTEVWCITSDQRRTVETGSAGVDFVMEDHLVVLRFVDDRGRPFRRAGISVKGMEKGEETFSMAGIGDEGGVKALSASAGMTLRITPSSAKGYEKRVTDFLVEGPPAVHDVPIPILRNSAWGSLEIRVRDDAGGRPASVFVTIENEAGAVEEGWYEHRIDLDPEGACVLDDLAPGRLRTRVSTDRWFPGTYYGIPVEGEASVEAGKTARLDLLMKSGGRLSVTCIGRDGPVPPQERLRILDASGIQVPATFWSKTEKGWSSPPRAAGPAVIG